MATLVVGAGKGIGFDVVKEFLKKFPEKKIVAVSRNVENLLKLTKTSSSLIVIKCDITSEKDLADLKRKLVQKKIKLTYILNLAGILIKKDWQKLSSHDFNEIYQTNVYAPFNIIRILADQLEKNKKGHIVNIGSMGGVEGTLKFPGMIFYSSSKAALSCMTECLAEELKEFGIHVNCIALGAVETEMKRKAFPNYRAPHSPREIAQYLIRFLVEDRNYFNGKVIKLSISTP